jgi:hypothetical protein
MDDHTHLENLKGVIELPHFENSNIAAHRPHHDYRLVNGIYSSIYQRFNDTTLIYEDVYDTIPRTYQSNRFIFENERDTVDVMEYNGVRIPVYTQVINTAGRTMIGNPFMAQLDFDKLYEFNQAAINNFYEIYDGNTSSFLHYRYQNGVGTSAGMTNAIAPLQGFVIDVKSAPVTLVYPMANAGLEEIAVYAYDKNYGMDLGNKPKKESKQQDGSLKITAIMPPRADIKPKKGMANDSVRISATLLFNSGMESISKVLFPEDLNRKTELFFIQEEFNKANVEQVENNLPEYVKLAYQSTYPGKIWLCLEREGLIKDAQVWLIDEITGKQFELTGDKYYHQFTNYSVTNINPSGIYADRFKLRFKYPDISIGESQNMIRCFVDTKKALKVESTELIEQINIVDMNGVKVMEFGNVNDMNFAYPLDLPSATYVVEVKTNNKVSNYKVIIR